MVDTIFVECEFCPTLENGMSLYSINALVTAEAYVEKYMKAHYRRYHNVRAT